MTHLSLLLLALLQLSPDPGRHEGDSVPARADRNDRRITPVVQVVQQVGPAVVNISSTRDTQLQDPLFRFFYGGNTRSQSLGSGVVIDPDGYVVTNAHVVRGANGEVTVRIGNSDATAAEIIWIDQSNDLALLKIRGPGPFPSAGLGTSDDIMMGETVLALGNPYGYDNTVSQGIVSATNRALRTPTGASFVDFIQTDAALHPGNSGGPLVNINGEVIGINTMIQTGTEAIGFAIPIDRVRKILLERLTNYAQIRGIYLGARIGTEDGRLATVRYVEPESPAQQAGIRVGDEIRALDGKPVGSVFDFNKRLLEARPGQRVQIEVDRPSGGRQIELVLGSYNRNPEDVLWQRLGLQVTDRDAYNRRFKGVMVVRVQQDGPAQETGLRRGDFLHAMDGKEIDSFESFYYAVTESTGEWLNLDVVRGREEYEGEIRPRPFRAER